MRAQLLGSRAVCQSDTPFSQPFQQNFEWHLPCVFTTGTPGARTQFQSPSLYNCRGLGMSNTDRVQCTGVHFPMLECPASVVQIQLHSTQEVTGKLLSANASQSPPSSKVVTKQGRVSLGIIQQEFTLTASKLNCGQPAQDFHI